MPSAPASSASTAARVTLGMPIGRVLRTRATLFRLTLNAVMSMRCFRLELLEVLQDAPRVERLGPKMVANHPPQQPLGLGRNAVVLEAPLGHRQQRAPGDDAAVV